MPVTVLRPFPTAPAALLVPGMAVYAVCSDGLMYKAQVEQPPAADNTCTVRYTPHHTTSAGLQQRQVRFTDRPGRQIVDIAGVALLDGSTADDTLEEAKDDGVAQSSKPSRLMCAVTSSHVGLIADKPEKQNQDRAVVHPVLGTDTTLSLFGVLVRLQGTDITALCCLAVAVWGL